MDGIQPLEHYMERGWDKTRRHREEIKKRGGEREERGGTRWGRVIDIGSRALVEEGVGWKI